MAVRRSRESLAPASPAFPSCSLAGFSRDSARPHVIYLSVGTEHRVLESQHPNSGKCRASTSREGWVPSSGRAGSIGSHPQQRTAQLPSLLLRICAASAAPCTPGTHGVPPGPLYFSSMGFVAAAAASPPAGGGSTYS